MKKILHIIATPRGAESRTLKISKTFLEELKHKPHDWEIDELNLFEEQLPELTIKNIDGKYQLLMGKELSLQSQEAWQEIVAQIERFKSADAYLFSAPMWNFNIPYKLKHYLDVIIQPKYLFEYTEEGPAGLIRDKKAIVITTRGGDYSQPELSHLDLQEPYLRMILEFLGFAETIFINAQPIDAADHEQREAILAQAYAKAKEAADWL